MKQEIVIRTARQEDAAALAELMNELGYPSTQAQMSERMEAILLQPAYTTLLACLGDSIVGMLGACHQHYYEHNGSYVRILALVTHKDHRKIGVAQTLLAAAEDWARERDAGALVLNCGNREERAAAHKFYAARGFRARSTGYVRMLAPV